MTIFKVLADDEPCQYVHSRMDCWDPALRWGNPPGAMRGFPLHATSASAEAGCLPCELASHSVDQEGGPGM